MFPTFRNYKVLDRVAEGGSSFIWRAERPGKPGVFAIKQLKPTQGPAEVKSFRSEMKLLGELEHEGLLKLHETAFESTPPYAVLDYFPSANLKTLIREKSVRLAAEWKPIAMSVAETLLYLHLNDIVHKDIKPENILLGKGDDTRLIDLSIAERKSFLPAFGKRRIQGTPAYMAPEQILGKPVDHRADIYSLGAALYEMVTGQPPFVARSQDELLQKHLREKSKPARMVRPEVPEALEKLLVKMLAKDPDDRVQDCNLVVYELKRIEVPAARMEPVTLGRRRDSTRLSVRLALCLYAVTTEDTLYQVPSRNKCPLINVSRTGIGFFSDDPIPTEAILDLSLYLPPLRAPLQARGRVVWANRVKGQDSYSIGVRLTMRAKDYIAKFEELKKYHVATDPP